MIDFERIKSGWGALRRGRTILAMSALFTILPAIGETPPDAQFFAQQVRERYVEPFREGKVDEWLSAFAADAIALHNFRDADRGRDAIRAFGEMVHSAFLLAQYDVDVTDVRVNGAWAYTAGVYTSRFVSKLDGSEPFGLQRGKFVLLWERDDTGEWLIMLDMGNSSE
jgi:ketosteroid isomerase-like protein